MTLDELKMELNGMKGMVVEQRKYLNFHRDKIAEYMQRIIEIKTKIDSIEDEESKNRSQ